MCTSFAILFLLSLMNICNVVNGLYEVPEALVEPLSPLGFRVSIPDTPGIQIFAFHGSINEPLQDLAAGTYSRDILRTTGGRWVFEDLHARLSPGDKIYYWTYVQLDGLGYRRDRQEYTVPYTCQPPEQTSSSALATLTDEIKSLKEDVKSLTSMLTKIRQSHNSTAAETGPVTHDVEQLPSSALNSLTNEVKSLKEDVKLLTSTLTQIVVSPSDNSAEERRFVVLSGAPDTGNVTRDVEYFLKETLGIDAEVEDAWISSTAGGTVVIMKNKLDKLRVLLSACSKDAKHLISNPSGSIQRDANVDSIFIRMGESNKDTLA